jgi:hypothetical protein
MRRELRSKSFPGISKAMADQWGAISVFSLCGGRKNEKENCT